MKRITAFLLAMAFIASAMSIGVFAAADKYWGLQAAYNKALETSGKDDDIKACEDIISYYKALDSETACLRVVSPILKLVKIYEERGQYTDALRCYEYYKKAYTYLDKNTSKDCTEALMYADAFIAQYQHIEPVVYTSAYNPSEVPFYNAKHEPEVGTYIGMSGLYDEGHTNAFLLYVQFGSETIPSFSYLLPETNENYLLEIAWNTSDHSIEFFEAVANGSYDAYIKENLEFVKSLTDCKPFIRFAAEVNEWEVNTTYTKSGEIERFKKAYIAAFRHLSKMVKTYAPNVAMVYSPNDISNMNVTPLDFYPGDEYVDWIGLSAYMNLSGNTDGSWGSMNDAYYGRGVYENQMIKIEKTLAYFNNRKPVMISESGFCYASTKSTQTMQHAKERMKLFYDYVNMVFPQVKAIFHFNTNYNGNSYKLFEGTVGSPLNELSEVYLNSVKNNIPISSLLSGRAQGYTRLETLSEKRDTLNLYVFASYPGNPDMEVSYTWDGKTVGKAVTAPYSYSITSASLTEGRHTLAVSTACKNTKYTLEYTVYVDSKGTVTAIKKDLNDIPTNGWMYPYVSYCVQEGFFKNLINDSFSPLKTVTRSEFVMLLGRAVGIDTSKYNTVSFSDVPKNAAYAPYVAWAKEVGVTGGVSETEFAPNSNITREQICAMLVRLCVNTEIFENDVPESYKKFADHSDIASYFINSVYKAREKGLVNGRENNKFDPKANINRQEISVILKNFHIGYIR